MAREERSDGPFEDIDSKLTIYALANGMDLVKEPSRRRLGWYREGREREIRISAKDGVAGYALTAAAFSTGRPEGGSEAPLARIDSAGELQERLSALLEEGQARANEL